MAGKAINRRAKSEYARKVSYNKRKKCLVKKLNEITTLCDVEGCAVIYNPGEDEPKPEVFPANDISKVVSMISKFESLPETERAKMMLSEESYVMERIDKAGDQLQKLQAQNRERMVSDLWFEHLADSTKSLDDLSDWDLHDLDKLNARNLRQIDQYIEDVRAGENPRLPVPDMMQQLAALYPTTMVSTTLQLGQNMVGEDVKPGTTSMNRTASDE
ncbi:hypothetical protein RND81_07G137200 [Saponaria officinalis]|uniref:MADS-box domain-containing protein n=1 Tax=Saponaria officinalis TaxID=3572 RepID=A0AAW1JQ41_SAPOF